VSQAEPRAAAAKLRHPQPVYPLDIPAAVALDEEHRFAFTAPMGRGGGGARSRLRLRLRVRDRGNPPVFTAPIWAEADALLDADAFAGNPADDWYRQPIVGISLREMCPVSRSETTTVRRHAAEDEPRELTFVDADTFWAEF